MKYFKLFVVFSLMLMFYQCEETLTSSSKITYEVGAVSFTDAVDQNGNGYASQVKFSFDIDVSKGTENVYVVISKRVHDASNNSTYDIYFTSQSFSITEDNSDDARYIMIGDPNTGAGELPHNSYDFLIQVYKEGEESDAVAEASMSRFSDMGNVLMETAAEDSPVRVQFNNKVFTDISITVNNNDTKVIPPQDSVIFNFTNGNPGTISISAETYGKTSDNQQIGEKVTWTANVDVSGNDFMKINLNLDASMYFMYMENTGSSGYAWNPIYINPGTDNEKIENIVVPSDGNVYRIGYYSYVSGSSLVRAHWQGQDDTYYTEWTASTTGKINQAWKFTDGSYKKPAAAGSGIEGDLIYEIGSAAPVERKSAVKDDKNALNLTSEITF